MPSSDMARCPFDLAAEIPLRARLFRVADDEHVLVAVVHHIAADGWSIAPLVRDLGVAYTSRCTGQRPLLGRICRCSMSTTRCGSVHSSATLADSQSAIAAQLAYWEDALAGMPEHLQLPTDRPYPPVSRLPRRARVVRLAGRAATGD